MMGKTPRFHDFGLSAHVLKAIDKKGFEHPTDIQALTIPLMMENEINIIAQAQTGSGKTAAFGLPLIEMSDPNSPTVQALILVPTRELALQVAQEIDSLKGDKDLKIVPIYGGQAIEAQLKKLKQGVHIVVGTPGRVIDHLHRKSLKLDQIDQLILDEADEMLNMGFIEDMEEIMRHTNSQKRTLLFSATMPQRIKDLARKYIKHYELLKTEKEQLMPNQTDQFYYEVRVSEKLRALILIMDFEKEFYGLVFCKTRKDAADLAEKLIEKGYNAEAIHGEISQAQRERSLKRFRQRKVKILVATDVADRGIDVNDLPHVVNYALPQDPESYVHRIGRTGRAGKKGTAITFVTPSDFRRFKIIQQMSGKKIYKAKLPTPQEIIQSKIEKINADLEQMPSGKSEAVFVDWAQNLLEGNDAVEVLSSVLQYNFQHLLQPKNVKDVASGSKEKDRGHKARLFISLGRQHGLTPRKLVALVAAKTQTKASHIDDVKVKDEFSFITVPFERAMKIISQFKDRNNKQLATFARSAHSAS